MRAISAPRSQRACHEAAGDVALVADRLRRRAPRLARRDRAQPDHASARSGARPVDALGRALGLAVVGAEQRRHALRVGRAAGVLEQQRVEEVRAVGVGRPISSASRMPIMHERRRGRAAGPRSCRARRRASRRRRTARCPHARDRPAARRAAAVRTMSRRGALGRSARWLSRDRSGARSRRAPRSRSAPRRRRRGTAAGPAPCRRRSACR